MNYLKRCWVLYLSGIVQPFIDRQTQCTVCTAGGKRYIWVDIEELKSEFEQVYFNGGTVFHHAMMKALEPGQSAAIETKISGFGEQLNWALLEKIRRNRQPRRSNLN